MIRVGVFGASGKMGEQVCRAVHSAPDMELTAAVDPFLSEEIKSLLEDPASGVADSQGLSDLQLDVMVDFTHPDAVEANIRHCIEAGINIVVGTTGLPSEKLEELGKLASDANVGLFVAANFAIGAVLMMRFAAEAARHLPLAEIVEMHHDQKADAPSGTSLATASAMRKAREEIATRRVESLETVTGALGADSGDGIRIHSIRLPGFVAHQEVILSGPGETLTIRHDSIDRAGFMPGVLLAVRAVGSRPGLTVGLEHLL
jgi:4-hydroxy-tetrahydrodipicolinate reductase